MRFLDITPTAANAPWLLRPPAERRIGLAEARERLAGLPPPGHVQGFEGVVTPRAAAVLVPLGELDGEAAIAVTKRPETMRLHRDVWVFPGGRFDPAVDADTRDTALREASEELGFRLEDMTIAGRLNSRGPISSGFVLDVYVALVDFAQLAPDPREVADCLVVPLSALAMEAAYRETHDLPKIDFGPPAEGVVLPSGPRLDRRIRFFELRAGDHLWGLQGEMLHELLACLLPAR